MYKTRIKVWGLTKYVKHTSSTRERKRGRSRAEHFSTHDNVTRMQLVRNEQNADRLELASSLETNKPKVVELGLLVPTSISIDPTSLSNTSTPEKLLFLTGIYFDFRKLANMPAARQSTIFLGISAHRIARKRAIHITSSDFLFLQDIKNSVNAMHKGDSRKAGYHWRSAFGKFEKGLCENDLMFLLCMVGSMRLLVRNGFDQVALMLQHHIVQLAAFRLAAHHPFRLFVEILARTELCFFEWLLRNAIGLVGEQLVPPSFLPVGSWTFSVLTELGPADKSQRTRPNRSALAYQRLGLFSNER
jgi:hypothetical protein